MVWGGVKTSLGHLMALVVESQPTIHKGLKLKKLKVGISVNYFYKQNVNMSLGIINHNFFTKKMLL